MYVFFIRFRKHTTKIFAAMCADIIVIVGMSRMTFFKCVANRFIIDNIAEREEVMRFKVV